MLIHGINDCQDLHMRSNVKINMDEQCSSLLHFGFCGMAHVFFLPQTHYGPGALHTEKSPIFNYEMCSLNTSCPSGVNRSSLITLSLVQSFILIDQYYYLRYVKMMMVNFAS